MGAMNKALKVQGRTLEAADIERIRQLLSDNPGWSRRRLSQCLAEEWGWRNGRGQLKDMAARSLLVKLSERGHIELPPRRQMPSNRMVRQSVAAVVWDTTPVTGTLDGIGPLTVREVSTNAIERD